MKKTRITLFLLIGIYGIALSALAQTITAPATAIYVASTPCTNGTRPVPGIPKNTPCELIKWELRLSSSGTYILDCVYGMSKQGSKGFINGGSRLHREGKWVIKGNKTNLSAPIYRLDPDKPSESIAFARLNENLLHLLDSRQQLMIGNGAWSYTLNKVQP